MVREKGPHHLRREVVRRQVGQLALAGKVKRGADEVNRKCVHRCLSVSRDEVQHGGQGLRCLKDSAVAQTFEF